MTLRSYFEESRRDGDVMIFSVRTDYLYRSLCEDGDEWTMVVQNSYLAARGFAIHGLRGALEEDLFEGIDGKLH